VASAGVACTAAFALMNHLMGLVLWAPIGSLGSTSQGVFTA
jgi:hypothetical protein